MILMDMRNNIKELRTKAGLTQADLGGLIGKTKGQISKLESGAKVIDVNDLEILTRALNERLEKKIFPWHIIADPQDLETIVHSEEERRLLERRRSLAEEEQRAFDAMTASTAETLKTLKNPKH